MTNKEIIDNISVVVDHLSRLNVTKTSSEIDEMFDRQEQHASSGGRTIDEYVGSRDTRLAKIIAAAVVVAKHKGIQSIDKDTSYGIAATADEAAARVKLAKDIVNGDIDIEDAAEHLVDRAASRMITFTDKCIKSAEHFTKTVISSAVSTYCPELKPVVSVMHNVVSKCSNTLRSCVRSGIRAFSNAAKPVVRAVASGARSLCRKVINFIRR